MVWFQHYIKVADGELLMQYVANWTSDRVCEGSQSELQILQQISACFPFSTSLNLSNICFSYSATSLKSPLKQILFI